jgi:hypothetical protein
MFAILLVQLISSEMKLKQQQIQTYIEGKHKHTLFFQCVLQTCQTSILTYIEDEPLFVASILSLFYSNLSQKKLFCCI